MLAWTKQNTMQRAMRTVLEWPQSHAIRKTINMITNKYCQNVYKALIYPLDNIYIRCDTKLLVFRLVLIVLLL